MQQSTRIQSFGTFLVVSMLHVGCVVTDDPMNVDVDDRADVVAAQGECENAFVQRDHEATLRIEAPMEFDFCPTAQGPNLTNMLWMAYFASNEYSHAGYILPELDRLGFGNSHHQQDDLNGETWTGSEAEYLYDCIDSLYWFRCMEERVDTATLWTEAIEWPYVCAHQYRQGTQEQPASLGADFEHWFIQDDHDDWSIQFFSGGNGILEFKEGSTQMMWAEHGEMPLVILAFRGTEPGSFEDILVDLHLFHEDFAEWGQVHAGFSGAFESVFDNRIEARLQYLADYVQEANIWITGHSLGGALATLMTAWILERMERDQSWQNLGLRGLVTFGSPRVGDGDFNFNFNRAVQERGINVLRVVHGDDTVTNIPKDWPWVGLDYEHVGDTVYLGQEDDQDCCPLDNPDCCAEGLGVCPGPCLIYTPDDLDLDDVFGSPSDHSMMNYYERIRTMYDYQGAQQLVGCEQ